MAKLDLRSAYRMVPVHPDDQPLLCIQWHGVTYCNQALPFGLRLAPKLFTAVADGLAWVLACRGAHDFLHYLDDFFFCEPSSSPLCGITLNRSIPLCGYMGLPVAPDKVEGQSTCITFLGIEIDSIAQVLRLPPPKLARLQTLIQDWSRKQVASKHQLQVLIGHLNHVAAVVRPGQTFLHHLISTMSIPSRPNHLVRLNEQCRSDIAWWALFLASWNGVSFLPSTAPWEGRSLQMHQGGAVAHTILSLVSGSSSGGPSHGGLSTFLPRSCFPWWLLQPYGVGSGQVSPST